MDWYPAIKTIHIISSTLLFGTGIGIAFFMLRSRCTDNLREKRYAAGNTVLADYLFTLPAVILQPLSGAWLVWQGGFGWTDSWLIVSYGLYLLAGLCWLPVVRIQHRLYFLVSSALRGSTGLPDDYHRLFRYWMLLGIPAFGALVVVFFLMVMKPV